jgi:hypothetical protein
VPPVTDIGYFSAAIPRAFRITLFGRFLVSSATRLSLILILMIGFGLSGCQGTPTIAKNLSGRTWKELNDAFNARVQWRFPVGSSEAAMLTELKREHFKPDTPGKSVPRYQFSVLRDLPGLPCRQFWRVEWNSDAGNITDIEGGYGGVCL